MSPRAAGAGWAVTDSESSAADDSEEEEDGGAGPEAGRVKSEVSAEQVGGPGPPIYSDGTRSND